MSKLDGQTCTSASPELEEKKRPHLEQRQLLSPSPIVAAFARTKPPPTSKPRATLTRTDAGPTFSIDKRDTSFNWSLLVGT
ncbi:hypothetical protein PC123_g23607 [Phytophthora cactorum]|nr:hypothetical protein PC123_g23607 [Phytophthora cactorum]